MVIGKTTTATTASATPTSTIHDPSLLCVSQASNMTFLQRHSGGSLEPMPSALTGSSSSGSTSNVLATTSSFSKGPRMWVLGGGLGLDGTFFGL